MKYESDHPNPHTETHHKPVGIYMFELNNIYIRTTPQACNFVKK